LTPIEDRVYVRAGLDFRVFLQPRIFAAHHRRSGVFMSREGAARLIIEAANLEEYQPTAKSSQAFDDLALGCRVHATLFALPGIKGSALEVRATEGHIHVGGKIEQGMKDEPARIVRIIPGVTDVTTDVYAIPAAAFLGP
jgi:HSP20 family molecular chaperone IbpA